MGGAKGAEYGAGDRTRDPPVDLHGQASAPRHPLAAVLWSSPLVTTEAPATTAAPTTTPPVLDTVEVAAATPEKEQPYAALGLKPDEYERIRNILGRRPTSAELAMYSVMWSEHCSYKSSKIYLRQFGKKVTPEMKQHLMVGMGENAGVTFLPNWRR